MIQAPGGPGGGMPMYNYYITECVDGNGKYIDKINNNFYNPFDKCSLTEYNIQAGNCYSSPYNNEVIYRGNARKGKAPKKINDRCLIGGGWCPCGTNNNNGNNNGNNNTNSYGKDRCLRKLPNVKWKNTSNGHKEKTTTNVVKYHCNLSECQNAYDDNKSTSYREKYWKSCRDGILSEYKNAYHVTWTVDSDTVNFY